MTKPEIITFGCRLNVFESEIIRDKLKDITDENMVVINSCAVTSEAVRQVKQRIRREKRNNPTSKVIVTGCAAQINPDNFAAMPEVDLVIGNADKFDLQKFTDPIISHSDFGISDTEKIRVNDIMEIEDLASHMLTSFDGRSRAFIQIQNGCDHRCTFCIIPYGRGNSRSVPLGDIIKQIELLVSNNVKEVVLTGVDITSYGNDLPGKPGLSSLISRILTYVPELPRLRLSSIDSIELDDEFLGLLSSYDRLMPHLHLSLQSGNDMILKRMKRRHNRDNIIDFCKNVRKIRHDIIFGADIIAGFPTETEDMFADSYNLLVECGFTYLHVFPFSPREGTPAARMPQVAKNVIKERAARLRKLGEQQLNDYYDANIGNKFEILMEKPYFGRTPQFNIVRLTTPYKTGDLVDVKISGHNNGEFKGVAI